MSIFPHRQTAGTPDDSSAAPPGATLDDLAAPDRRGLGQ
jgi:hypothetical protein